MTDRRSAELDGVQIDVELQPDEPLREDMETASVLMVDDDVELSRMVVDYLRADGFSAKAVQDGEKALEAVRQHKYDAMILDVMMPGLNGHEVLRRLQSGPSGLAPMPVLMLTARGDDVDRIVGLETGADDYLAKPCNLRELAARLRAILRRSMRSGGAGQVGATTMSVAGIELDVGRRSVSQSGEQIGLTGAEFAVLKTLMEFAGQTVSKDALTRAALGREYTPYDRSIDVHIANLRKKLAQNDSGDSRIKTVRGNGYQLADRATP
jgi:two-component system response regulator CpxR